ncbi:MAG: sensor histidine kinase [Candidatus Dadabacteria bacterium]|nr:MAG: sensor histidine kinase [Candidatus Dadabacteria bacterium]
MKVFKKYKGGYKFRVALVIFWTLFTTALISWWYLFAIHLVEQLSKVEENSEKLKVAKRMLSWEGATLVILLIIGGIGLSYYIIKEWQEHEKIKKFFLTFAHEVKTPLSALQLRIEAFEKDPAFLKDLRELYRKIENSFIFAELDKAFKQKPLSISIGEITTTLKEEFPDLEIIQEGEAELLLDPRASLAIFNNLLHNALIHGEAKKVQIRVVKKTGRKAVIEVSNDGKPCLNADTLGREPFLSAVRGSGTGLGLYLVREIVAIYGGEVKFLSGSRASPWGFKAVLSIPVSNGKKLSF